MGRWSVVLIKPPCQAVCNKLAVSCLPEQFKSVRKLERVLISKRLLLKKVTIMPKGQSPKLKGALCNIPVKHVDVSSLLPRTADSNGLVIVKFKKKLEHKGHGYLNKCKQDLLWIYYTTLKKFTMYTRI